MNRQTDKPGERACAATERGADAPITTARGTPERALRFQCQGDELIGILHPGSDGAGTAVLVIVGEPQYRVGSHRQFVQLARALAAQGIPVLRFDCRGMGDGEGDQRDFEDVQADIRAAMDTLCSECPSVRDVTLWGLCDGASAACFYAACDARVTRLVLLNPWVRTAQGEARAYLAQYYAARILSRGFWLKLLRGEVHLLASIADFVRKLLHALRGNEADATSLDTPREEARAQKGQAKNGQAAASVPAPLPARANEVRANLPDRMASGLETFHGKVLFLLSGRDLTAQEFRDVCTTSKRWRALMAEPRCTVIEFAEADHTFSSPAQSAAATQATLNFLAAL